MFYLTSTRSIRFLSCTLAIVLLCWNCLLQAQHSVPFENGYPVAPTGLASPPLGDGPWVYPTAEGMDIKVSVIARLEYPMSLAFLPENKILIVTRKGKIRLVENRNLSPQEIAGGPDSVFFAESGQPGSVHGYLDIALHPDFEQNRYVYLNYTKPMPNGERALSVGRGKLSGNRLEDFTDIFTQEAGLYGASRIAFGHDKTLYITTTGNGDPQDLNSLSGKLLRLNDDGSIPADNPFVNQEGARPEIYSYGHRGALGLVAHPGTGVIWQNENGPQGGDEINQIKPGVNYGWPIVSFGRTYQGPWQSEAGRPTHENFEPPVVYWVPAIAPSGMIFYTGDALPMWKGDIFVGSLREGSVPGTGHIERIVMNEDYQDLRRESLLTDLRQRVRDVRQGPDGLLYLVTDEKDGALLVIEPAE